MPTIAPQTLRAYVFLDNGEDYPANELSYYSDVIPAEPPHLVMGSHVPVGEPEYIRFNIIHTPPNGEKIGVGGCTYVMGGHSQSHWEREFREHVAKFVTDKWAEKRAAFEKLRAIMDDDGE